MDNTTLLNTIQSEYANLETLIAPLNEMQLSEEILTGMNDRIFLENRNRPLHEVQKDFRQMHERFLQQVTTLIHTFSEEEITTPHRFAWTEPWQGWVEPQGHSLLAIIADNSYHHYRDHAQQIRRSPDAPA